MKIAVGIIGVGLGLMVLMQSCAITGLSALGDQEEVSQAGSLGMLAAFLMFFGGAFAFGSLPRVACAAFLLSFVVSELAKEAFPDMAVWGTIALILGVLLGVSATWNRKANAAQKSETE